MTSGDIKDILIVLIGAMVTLGVEWIRRKRSTDPPPPQKES